MTRRLICVDVPGIGGRDPRRATKRAVLAALKKAGVPASHAARVASSAAEQVVQRVAATRLRVLLVSRYSEGEVQRMLPGLAAIGVDVARVVGWDDRAQIRDVDALALMHQRCSHSEFDAWRERARRAGVPTIRLPREPSGWTTAVRAAGLRLPVAP